VHARRSIAIDSTSADGHAWLAAALGLAVEKSGTKEKLRSAGEIKQELDTALRLNPNDQTALSMLGSYYREAAGIGWFKRMMGGTFVGKMPEGDYEDAKEALQKAITLDPRVIRNYHELALVELELGHKKEAVVLMEAAMDQPILFYSDRRRLRQMRRLLEKLQDD
jgi:tetratricopeptide (TPR) repeat protein